jgi:molecular chaperone HscB
MTNETADDFALFGIERRFAQDRALIDARWKALQAQVHPDRFAADGAAAQRAAMERAIRVNDAYRRLKDPLERAALLCRMNGQDTGESERSAIPAAFLMQQIAWREALEEMCAPARVEALAAEVDAFRQRLQDELELTIDARQDWAAAAAQVRTLMFVERFVGDLERRLETLAD